METPDMYREFAEQCEQMAKDASAAPYKEILEEMANEWRKLAKQAVIDDKEAIIDKMS